MRKLLLTLVTFLTCIGVGWAETATKTVSFDTTTLGSTSTSYVKTAWSFTTEDVTYTINYANPSSGQVQANANPGSAFYIFNTTSIGGAITKIEVVYSAVGTTPENAYLTTGTSSITTAASSTEVTGTISDGTVTYDLSSNATNDFFRIDFNKNIKGTNKISKIVISYEENSDIKIKTTPTLNLSSEGKEFTTYLGEEFTAPTVSIDPESLASELTYSSSNADVATVNESTGVVEIVGVGTTTITASYAGSDDYYANSISYTITVKDPSVYEVTFDFVNKDYGYTRSSSEYLTEMTFTESDRDLAVTALYTKTASSGNGARLWTDGLRIYSTSNFELTAPTGYEITSITVSGTSVYFDGSSDKSTTWTGNKKVVNVATASGSLTIKSITVELGQKSTTQASEPTIKPASGSVLTLGDKVTIESDDEGATIKYAINDGDEQTYSEPFVLSETEEGTFTVTAYAEVEGKDKSEVATATYTVKSYNVANIAKWLEAAKADKGTSYTITGDVTVSVYATTTNSSGSVQTNIYVQDATGSLLIYDAGSNNSADEYNNGDVLTGIKGYYTTYSGVEELIPTEVLPTATAGEEIEPTEIEPDGIEEHGLYKYVVVKGATISLTSGRSYTLAKDDKEGVMYDQFSVIPEDLTGTFDVYGVTSINVYNSNTTYRILPIEVKAVESEEVEVANPVVELDENTAVGDKITITSAEGTYLMYAEYTESGNLDDSSDSSDDNSGSIDDSSSEGDEDLDMGEEARRRVTASDVTWVSLEDAEVPNKLTYTLKLNTILYVKAVDMTTGIESGVEWVNVDANGLVTGVKGVAVSDADAAVEYFNMQGVRVINPENGLYIRRQGNKVTKVIIR